MISFWDWAVSAYGKPGVAPACLDLQDSYGEIVPLLLWAAWLTAHNRTFDDDLATQGSGLARNWSDTVVAPLRNLRRRLTSPVTGGDDDLRLPLREKIKGLELDAERAVMEILSGLSSQARPMNLDINQPLNERMLDALSRVSLATRANAPQLALTTLAEALTKP